MVGWGRRLNQNGMGRLEMLKQLTLGAAIVAGALLLGWVYFITLRISPDGVKQEAGRSG